jgi:hypothetical protein
MLVIVPFLSITAAAFLDKYYRFLLLKRLNKFTTIILFYAVLITALASPPIFSFPFNFLSKNIKTLQRDIPSIIPLAYYIKLINCMEPDNFLLSGAADPQWVGEAVKFLKTKDVAPDEWVFTTYSNTVFLFYSDYKVQLIWPVKKTFLDSFKERFWIIIGPYDNDQTVCHWFYKFSDSVKRCENMNYRDIIKSAKKYTLTTGAVIYECNSS